jgi:starch synthase
LEAEKKLKVILTAAEVSPYAKTGGLADVAGSLPKALSSLGNIQILTMMPRYKSIDESKYELKSVPRGINFSMAGKIHGIGLKYIDYTNNCRIYFIENWDYFGRDGLYGYNDDALRFAFFARAVLESAKALDFKPDVIHCNDWHTGLIPTYLKTLYKNDDFFKNTATVFTIHNLGYQGVFPKELLPMIDVSWEEFKIERLEYWDRISFIKGGLVYSDVINTVSKQYSKEIQTQRYGENLDGLLRYRQNSLYGIVNGLDYDVWNPATDKEISQRYNPAKIDKKVENKIALQKEKNLKVDPDIPMLGVISRLSYQKGLDLIAYAAQEMVSIGIQLVILGTGEEYLQNLYKKLAYDFPDNIKIDLAFSEPIARRIYASSDIFLMPSRYEPCGLSQLIAMKYGTIPVVRKTGGLVDTVQEYDPGTGIGTGFFFEDEHPGALMWAIKKALDVFHQKEKWKQLIINAMTKDFSWANSAREYLELYKTAISGK